ncbi:hypothetical protein [Ramlibacter albus]|uniref:EF-hand domain-containing protein n=1 Tax=Ramlibacter albus TaxID=2079448 RepID=A0A923M8G4_9BURK|nr:hypothetical protein [Ramlibacter albus]MBC5765631.1 hypothetical protein [Ramlibacter albus]
MKHIKLIAALATAGSLFGMAGAAHAIAPAAALGLAAISGAAIGSSAQANHDINKQAPQAAVVVPANPTVVMGAPAATVITTTPSDPVLNGTLPSVTNYDHDGDGVLNNVDRYPNDPSKS